MNKVFLQRTEQPISEFVSNGTNNKQKKSRSRRWHISVGPLIVSSFLTLALFCVCLTTAESGDGDALPAAYFHHASHQHIQSIVQSQHIVIPAPITPTSTLQGYKGNIK